MWGWRRGSRETEAYPGKGGQREAKHGGLRLRQNTL